MAKILIVDDHPVNRQFLAKLLGYIQHTVYEAADGFEALEVMRTVRPDLIITDIVMPRMDGITFVKQLRANPTLAAIPVVFYTACHRVPDAQAVAKECGVVHVLNKPVRPADILKTVSELLGSAAPVGQRDNLGVDIEHLRLAALTELGLELTKEIDPARVLDKVCQALRYITGAALAGILVVDSDGQPSRHFVRSSPDEDEPFAADPGLTAKALMGLLGNRASVRLVNPEVPPEHLGVWPDQSIPSFLAASIPLPGRPSVAALYAIGKTGAGEFTRDDEKLAVTLAAQAAVAYENARLHAVLQNRAWELEREVAERQRAESERDRFFTQSLNLLFVAGFDGYFKRLNPAWETALGYALKELLAEPFLNAVHPDDRAAVTAEVGRLSTGQHTQSFECRSPCKDGSYRWFLWNVTPSLDQAEMYGTGHDITLRKQAEADLRERMKLATLSAEVGRALIRPGSIRDMLHPCAISIVKNLGAAFARIWTLNEAENMLELQASAGMYTHLDGPHSRVPVGQFKIGLIAQEKKPHLTNDVTHDPRVSDHEWARREGMVAFAGHPLLIDEHIIGVMALFAQQPLSETTLEAMAEVANKIALGIKRKRAEAERDRLLARLQMQIDRMPLAYILFDADFRVLDWNPAAERILGYTKGEALGMRTNDLNPPSFHGEATKIMVRIRAGDMAAHSVNENLTKDGRTIICEWFNTPLFTDDGRFGGLLCLGNDVTERKSLEAQFRQTQQRLHYVVASSPAVLYTLVGEGADLRPTWMSENVREMLGYPIEEIFQPRWWHERIHPEDLQRVCAEIQKELFAHGRLAHEHRFRHRDGKYRWLRSEMLLLRDPAGHPEEIVGSWSDITDRKQLEDQFRQAQKMEAVGQLAGGVAHDFNNLLTIINGYGQVLSERFPPGDPTRELLGQIVAAGDRAAGLTRQLLAFSRKAIIEPKILNLKTVVADVDKLLRRILGEDIQLIVVADPEPWAVKADPGQIEQVLMNLVVNARDAMPRGGRLTIEVRNVELDETYARDHVEVQAGPHVLLAVSDTGCGMDRATIARIFEPFFSTKGEKGTGLGLATVHGIVKQSGGHVAVYSEVGHGTTFKVYLPRVQQQRAHSGKSHPGLAAKPLGSETVVVVEDEDSVRALIQYVLKDCGYTVLVARDGAEALRIAGQHGGRLDLLVTDVVLPRMSGREVAERLVGTHLGMKVLFVSGYTDDAVVRHGILDAEVAFLQKPFSPASLAAKVREVLDQQQDREDEA